MLVPLVNQFGMMQQQMLDQFQNAMGMLVEMFGTLQREQMDQIRQELDQLREVTREFQDVKLELAAYKQERAQAEAAGRRGRRARRLRRRPMVPAAPEVEVVTPSSRSSAVPRSAANGHRASKHSPAARGL